MKRIRFIFLLLFGLICTVNAQIDPIFFQQTHVRGLSNPAATGKGGDIYAGMNIRQQWIGFPGPSTQAILAHGFLSPYQSGIGLSAIFHDDGPLSSKNIKINYAFFIPFNDVAFLSLGAGLGFLGNLYKGGDYFIARDPDDEAVPLEAHSKLLPDFDFGFEFNTHIFEFGGAITHITYGYHDQITVRPMRNFIAYSRFKQPLNNNWDVIPGVTWQYNRKVNTFEITTGLRYNNNFCADFSYRNPMNLGVALGINLYENFRAVYSYDYGFDYLSSYNSGSHEITISYRLDMNKTYIKNKLRFFSWRMF